MKPKEQEKYELAVRAQQGDEAALSALVERLRLWLFAVAYAELRHYDDAQDAVASALVRICSHIGDLRDTASLRAWMRSIMQNEIRRIQKQQLHSATRIRLQDIADLPAPAYSSAQRLDVEQALRSLPALQAHALALFYMGNLSIREIAQRTGRPEGTIKSWLHHGRQQLAQSMKEYAPMTPIEWTAAIVSTELEPVVLSSLSEALRSAGFRRVNLFDDFRKVVSSGDFKILATGAGEAKDYVLPDALKGTHFIVLDQRIGRHSAFELHLILRAVEKEGNFTIAHCILLDAFDPSEEEVSRISIFASWLSGFDLCLTKPVKPEEFERLVRRMREEFASQQGESS